ncbi:hypothetical protein C8J57DRAFT_1466633 [Mycena rebaudengoi]|nr:hypothetical protein C8J57DRAFT_1466633 [Mycena rebaudengoi]
MCPAALAFIPTLHDVVALESFNGLGGSGLTRAFLRNPADGTGVLIDERGIIVAVPPEKWKVLVRAAEDAREAITGFVGGAICWSRSDDSTCSTDMYYDVGPPNAHDQLPGFQLTGHMMDDDDQEAIIEYGEDGRQTVVYEIPAPIVQLESAIDDICAKLLPRWDGSKPKLTIPREVLDMLNVVCEMSTMAGLSLG